MEEEIKQQITLKLSYYGELSSKITSSKKYRITNLKLIGEIDKDDFSFLRDLAGCDKDGNKTDGRLSILDLSEVHISGKNTQQLEHNQFKGCTALTNVILPSSLKWIKYSAFEGCTALTNVVFPSGLTCIYDSAFEGCIALTNVALPSGLTWIYDSAFKNCSALSELSFPSTIRDIGQDAFFGCRGLRRINIYAEEVPNMPDEVFNGCDSENCILFVPKGTKDAYWLSEFGYFENIIERK